MLDRVGVTHYPVSVTPVSGAALDDLKDRLHVMERELHHLVMAINRMKNGINGHNSRLLSDGVMDSRNWTLSAVMSHCYIQTLLGANPGRQMGDSAVLAKFHLYDMFHKAAEIGAQDGIDARRRFNVRPTDRLAQAYWD
jgi:hypothetical protein